MSNQGIGEIIQNLITLFEERALIEKHLAGKHNQKRHGWKYGGARAARQSMEGGSKFEREEYKRRARERSGAKAKPEAMPQAVARARSKISQARVEQNKAIAGYTARIKQADAHYKKAEELRKKREEIYKKTDELEKKTAEEERWYWSLDMYHNMTPAERKRYERLNKSRDRLDKLREQQNKLGAQANREMDAGSALVNEDGRHVLYKMKDAKEKYARESAESHRTLMDYNLQQAEATRRQVIDIENPRRKARAQQELKKVEADYEAAAKKWEESGYDEELGNRWQEQAERLAEANQRVYGGDRQRARELIKVDNPAQPDVKINADIDEWDAETRERYAKSWQNGTDEFSSLVGSGAMDGVPVEIGSYRRTGVGGSIAETGRSYHSEGDVYMADDRGYSTVIHEMGHALEYNDAMVHESAISFLQRRTRGETNRPLSEITGDSGYRPSEVAKPDKFMHPYMGKDYGGSSSEIVSMGMESVRR